MVIPTASDICPNADNLDGLLAVQHFLGKDLKQAENMFAEDRGYGEYWEDLSFMGPIAFRYYVLSAARYLMSERAAGDFGAALSFASCIIDRFQFEPDDILGISTKLRQVISHLISTLGKLECHANEREILLGLFTDADLTDADCALSLLSD